jgi:2-keto-4-pentenoate hydratase
MKIGSLAFLAAQEDSAEATVEKVAQIPEEIVEVETEKTGSIQITDIES